MKSTFPKGTTAVVWVLVQLVADQLYQIQARKWVSSIAGMFSMQ